MLETTHSAAPFYPPRVKPALRPLRFPFNVARLLGNNLEIIPEQAYRDPLVIAPGPPRMAFFTGTELVKTLLLTRPAEFPKGALQVGALKPMFGNAIVTSEGRDWRWQRGAAAPLFRHEEILRYGSIMTEVAEATVGKWRTTPPASTHAVHQDMLRAVFHVISKTMLAGVPDNMLATIEKGQAAYYEAVNWWLIYMVMGLPRWMPRPGGRSMQAHERRLHDTVATLVASRRAGATGGDDLLSRLVKARDPETGQSMSDELVVGNILAFLVGGNDTTAFALVWTLYLIARSPEWEARMLEEIEQVAGDGPVTSAHVERLGTVQQVLNESLRLFPTAPVIVRDIVEDVELEGVRIPAGTVGLIPIYAIHRHHNYWEDPNRFDPNRFTPENRAKMTRFQFLPFGAGPRICLGASFAMIEATIMLATFIRAAHFDVASDFDPQPSAQMFLLPKKGMPMRVTLRKSTA
jgi:cytochrome P450